MNKFLIFFLLILSSIGSYSQHTSLLAESNSFRLIESDLNGMTVEMEFGNLSLYNIKTDNGDFVRLIADQFFNSTDESQPELPVFNRLIEVPADAEIEVQIIEKEQIIIDLLKYNNGLYIYPAQPSVAKSDSKIPDFKFDKKTYKNDRFYSLPLVNAEILGQMRFYRIGKLSIAPVEYNPVSNQLRVTVSLKAKIVFRNGNLAKTAEDFTRFYSPSFEFISGELINHKDFIKLVPPPNQVAEQLLIVTDTFMKTTLKPFVAMKERQGFKVSLAFRQDAQVGTTLSSIQDYLDSVYNNSTAPPTYVILIGDHAQIPGHVGVSNVSHYTDLYYFEYTNDYFPEVFYGRFSCEDTTQLHNLLAKTLEYEQYLMPNPNYLDTSVLIAGHDNTYGPTHGNGQVNYASSIYYNSNNGIVAKTYLYPNSASQSAQIRSDANRGAALLNYSAHGSYDGWDNPSFENSHVLQMTNEHKYPVMIGNACLTGRFNENDCFGEVLTYTANKGAVGYIGASDNTYWDEDYFWAVGYTSNIIAQPTFAGTTAGFFDGIFHTHGEPYNQWALSLSQIIHKGNMAVTISGSNRIRYYWEVYHCFGDPTLVHFVRKPDPMTISHAPIIPYGTSSLTVSSVPYSLVGLSISDSLIASTYSDSLGIAQLSFGVLPLNSQVVVSVTAQNRIPYTGIVSVIVPNVPYVHLIASSIVDSLGNNNSKADNGETVKLSISLCNLSPVMAGFLNIKASSSDTSVIFIDSTETYNSFGGFDTVSFFNAFTISIKHVVKNHHLVPIDIQVADTNSGIWNSKVLIDLFAPELKGLSLSFDDAVFGNGNEVAEPGETLILRFEYKNAGENNLQNAIITSIPLNNLISGASQYDTIQLMEKDTLYTSEFIYTMNGGANTGDYTPIALIINASGYQLNKDFYIVAGVVDEDFESGDFKKFDWKMSSTPWIIDSSNYHYGTFSAQSGKIGNLEKSSMSLYMRVLKDDTIRFSVRTSSEAGYDDLIFYIDGLPVGKWSGLMGWKDVEFPMSAGYHYITWSYEKDKEVLTGLDAAWVDNIEFPLTDLLSEIITEHPEGGLIQVFPNPATDEIRFILHNFSGSGYSYQVYNSIGQLVLHEDDVHESEVQLDISSQQHGLYLLVVEQDGIRISQRFIKL